VGGAGVAPLARPGCSDQDGSARSRRPRGVEQPLEKLAVALDLRVLPAPLHEEPVKPVHSRLDDDVRAFDRSAPRFAVDDRRDFPADPELERAGGAAGAKTVSSAP
jgi:hypothetical protein